MYTFTQEVSTDVETGQIPFPAGTAANPTNVGIQNNSGVDVYVGGIDVDVSGQTIGWLLTDGQSWSGPFVSNEAGPYVVVAGGTAEVTIMVID